MWGVAGGEGMRAADVCEQNEDKREESLIEYAQRVAKEANVCDWPAWKKRFLFSYCEENINDQ